MHKNQFVIEVQPTPAPSEHPAQEQTLAAHTNTQTPNEKKPTPKASKKGHLIGVISLIILFAGSTGATVKLAPLLQSKAITTFDECIVAPNHTLDPEKPYLCYTQHGEVFEKPGAVLGLQEEPEPTATPIPTPTPTPSTNFRIFEVEGEVEQVDYINRASSTSLDIPPAISTIGDIIFLDEGIIYRYRMTNLESETIFTPQDGQKVIGISTPTDEYIFATILEKDADPVTKTIIKIDPLLKESENIISLENNNYQHVTHLTQVSNFHLIKASVCEEGGEGCSDYIYKVINGEAQPLTKVDSLYTQFIGYSPSVRSIIIANRDSETSRFTDIESFNVDTFNRTTIFENKPNENWIPVWLSPDHTQLAMRKDAAIGILDLSLKAIVDTQNINACKDDAPTDFSAWTSQGIMLKCTNENIIRTYTLDPLTYNEIELPEDFSGRPRVLGAFDDRTIMYVYPN